MRLSDHRHTGRYLRHHHTSFAALAFVVLLVGVLLNAITIATQANVPVTAVVNGPPPDTGATINNPYNGQVVNSIPITVSGTCEPGTVVRVYRNSVQAGATSCSGSGSFSVGIDLLVGSNTLTALNFDVFNRAGPATPSVTVTYEVLPPATGSGPAPPPPAPESNVPQLVLSADEFFRQARPGETIQWSARVSGGSPPYAISWNWGDGKTDVVSLAAAGGFEVSHAYASPGIYAITIQAGDGSGQEAYLEMLASVGGLSGSPTQPDDPRPSAVPQPAQSLVEQLLDNVVDSIRQIAAAITPALEAIQEEVIRIVKETPEPVARAFPYFLFALLVLLMLLLLYQTYREVRFSQILLAILQREKLIAEEKDNFIMLSSHYMRTPLTIIKAGVELAVKTKKVTPVISQRLQDGVKGLGERIEHMLQVINDNSILKDIKAPDIREAKVNAFTSPYFLAPVALVAAAAAGANYLFINVGNLDISLVNMITQGLVLAIIAFGLYSTLRSYLTKRAQIENTRKLLAHQRAVDQARNEFIHGSVLTLSEELKSLGAGLNDIAGDGDAMHVLAGYEKLNGMIAKFEWIARIESGNVGGYKREFGLKALVDSVLANNRETAAAKAVAVSASGNDIKLFQNQEMLGFVVSSVLDNAVKFSREKGNVSVRYNQEGDKVTVQITDNGAGMTPDQMAHLFKPFSRADSAMVFNQEGLGFSLFLAKVMLEYMEGNINVESEPGRGTTVNITVPHDLVGTGVLDVLPKSTKKPRVFTPVRSFAILLLVSLGVLLVAGRGGRLTGGLAVAWPLYGVAVFMVVSFWLGEHYETWREHHRATEL